jgi:hypothetical protein
MAQRAAFASSPENKKSVSKTKNTPTEIRVEPKRRQAAPNSIPERSRRPHRGLTTAELRRIVRAAIG